MMRDPRCLVGLHRYVRPSSTERSAYDRPGMYFVCNRCQKSKVVSAEPTGQVAANKPGRGGYA